MPMVNAFGDLSLEETQQAMLYMLTLITDKLARLDAADRLAVNVETGAVTASIAASQTLATVTTVTTVTDITRLNNMGAASRATDLIPHNTAMLGASHLYDNIVVS